MSEIQHFFSLLNQGVTFYLIFPVLGALGVFLSIKLKFLQFTQLKKSIRFLMQKEEGGSRGISNYQAIAAVIAGNLGTGNISGMAVALATGGPGSLVWMWLMAFLGSIIQYSSCVLGVKYRIETKEGGIAGGPMYYLKHGLGLHKTALIFAFCAILAAFAVGNFAQVNSMILPLEKVGCSSFICSLVIGISVALVMIGGVQRIAKAAAAIVPVMALIYLGTGCAVLVMYKEAVLPALFLMCKSAFQFSSFAGGIMGFGVMKALATGLERGVFATDAGTGMVPILQSGTRNKEPVVNGIVTLIAPFFVMLVCLMTGLILLVTGAFEESGLQSTNMVVYAFQKAFGENLGRGIVISALSLFAYTTILAWGGCASKAAEFLWGKRGVKVFLYTYLVFIPIGSFIQVDFVWVLADIAISLMLITNLIGVIGLFKEVTDETKKFFKQTPYSA